MDATALVTLPPLVRIGLLVLLLAALPLSWWWWRMRHHHRDRSPRAGLTALVAITLFLTFDLIVFGAFTRLSDSGLGCPDWPGCYDQASPLGAHADIHAAQTALPSGPVTVAKAWIEMVHRYLAMTVGLLIVVAAAFSWRLRRRLPNAPAWAALTLAWVLLQGLFGRYTVTLKLYPAIVTLHLVGGIVLLSLLVAQYQALRGKPLSLRQPPRRGAVAAVLAMLALQIALGGWVSSNYAVLACSGFPTCNGQWWPASDFGHGFTLLRELGRAGHGGFLPFDALVAIHLVHRAFAVAAFAALLLLTVRLWRCRERPARRIALQLAGLTLLQAASGLSNVVLGWPLLGALAHSGGAAALAGVLVSLLTRLPRSNAPERASGTADLRSA